MLCIRRIQEILKELLQPNLRFCCANSSQQVIAHGERFHRKLVLCVQRSRSTRRWLIMRQPLLLSHMSHIGCLLM